MAQVLETDKLTKRDLAAIQNYLAKITHKWIDIGVQLEMDPDYLENLNKQPNSSDHSNFRQMILSWLNGDDPVPTWKALCKALRAPAVEEEEIARGIEKERVAGEDVDGAEEGKEEMTTAPPPSVKVKTNHQVSLNDDEEETKIESEEIAFESSPSHHSDGTLEPFPHLHTSGLSAKEKESLLERLLQESAVIRLAFANLMSTIEASLISQSIDGEKIQNELIFGNFKRHRSYLEEKGIKHASAVIGKLSEYWNFCDFVILEHIISRLGTHEDRMLLEDYRKHLVQFAQRRAFECPQGILGVFAGENEEILIIKSQDKRTLIHDVTLNQILILSAILKKELDIEDSDMRLISYQKEDSSLALSFGVLKPAVDTIFPLHQSKIEKLTSLGVWYVKCQGIEFFEQESHDGLGEGEDEVLSESFEEEEKFEERRAKMEESTVKDQIIMLHNNVSISDEDIGTHTSVALNNKNLVVEVNTCIQSTYKSYKVSKQREGTLQWLSGVKGARYGTGKAPKVALNDQGFVVEVDEETDGYLSYRVGFVHSSHMMVWKEGSIFTSGSNPAVSICHNTVIAAFKRGKDAYYRVGTLNTDTRTISWSAQEHRFVRVISDLAVSANRDGTVVVIFSRTSVSSSQSSLYSVVGTLNKQEKRVLFSSSKASSLSISEGIFPSVAVNRLNDVIMTYVQGKMGIKRMIKYKHGKVQKVPKSNDSTVVWSDDEGVLDLMGVKGSVSMNDRGSILISHSTEKGNGFCHIGKLYCETTL